jgi:hypothetical protein
VNVLPCMGVVYKHNTPSPLSGQISLAAVS